MHPILFSWGDAVVSTYSVLIGLAFFAALATSLWEGRRCGLTTERVVNLCLGAFLTGLLGARLLYIAVEWPLFASGRTAVWELWEGGVVFYGGFLGALGFLAWNLRRESSERRWEILGALAPGLAFAHALGRVGCFMNGCCHGKRCDLPWAVTYSDPHSAAELLGVPVHPSQLYEAVGLVALGLAMIALNRRVEGRRLSAPIYFVAYGALRFFIEFTRGDSLRGEWGPFSTSQWISLAMIVFGTFILVLARRVRQNKRP